MSSTEAATVPAIQDLTGDYEIDPSHSRLGFVARHAMVTKVRGSFPGVTGRIHLDAQEPTRSSAEVAVDVATVATGDERRDGHLQGADFFDVENHPQITFRSTGVEVVDDERFRLTGDLTVKGVTRPVTLDVEYSGSAKDPFGNLRAGFEGRTEVNRKDWDLTWNAALETGGFLVSDKVRLEIDVSAIKLTPSS
jgi:polyisoprenoid-binding protein YceI